MIEDVWNARWKYCSGDGIVHHLAWDLQISMAGPDEEVSKMKAGIKRAGIDPAFLAVIVELPFQITVAAGAHAQS